MDWNDEKRLESLTRIGEDVRLIDRTTGRERLWGVVEDEVGIVVDGAKHVVQRVRLADDVRRNGNEYAYKTGSFTMKARGGIRWTPYAQTVSENELRELLGLMKKKGWPVL